MPHMTTHRTGGPRSTAHSNQLNEMRRMKRPRSRPSRISVDRMGDCLAEPRPCAPVAVPRSLEGSKDWSRAMAARTTARRRTEWPRRPRVLPYPWAMSSSAYGAFHPRGLHIEVGSDAGSDMTAVASMHEAAHEPLQQTILRGWLIQASGGLGIKTSRNFGFGEFGKIQDS